MRRALCLLAAATATVVTALETEGMILADNGSDWYLTGGSDDRWEPLVLDTGPTFPR